MQRRETDINLRFRTKTLVGQSVCTESVRQTQWPNANSDQRPFRVFLRPPPSSSYPPLLTLSLLASPSGSTSRHFLASLDLSSISPPRPVFIVSPFPPARYTGLTEIEGKQDGRFEKAAFIQPVISSAMRVPSFLSFPSNWILVSSNRGEKERDPVPPLFTSPMLAFLYSPPLLRPLLALVDKVVASPICKRGCGRRRASLGESRMKGGDSTVNLGVVFPRGAVDPSSRPSLAPRLGEKYHRRWVIEGSSNTSRILSRLVRILYRFRIRIHLDLLLFFLLS